MTTTDAAELPVPEQALIELHAACNREANADDFYGADYYSDEVRAIAGPVVAAELRRLLDEKGHDLPSGAMFVSARALRDRADQIAPEETP